MWLLGLLSLTGMHPVLSALDLTRRSEWLMWVPDSPSTEPLVSWLSSRLVANTKEARVLLTVPHISLTDAAR